MKRRMHRHTVVASVVPVAMVVTIACSGKSSTSPSPPAATITSVSVTGSAPPVGLTAQLTAMATLSDGTTQSVTSQAAWQSSNPAIATVTNAGLVTGAAPGDVDIIATYQSIAGRTRLTITRATFSITGNVTDATSTGVLPNINMQITTGPSTGTSAKTDATGAYSLTGVLAGDATVTASAVGYDTQAKTVTVIGNTRLDFVLVRVSPCAFSLSVTSQNVPASGGSFSFIANSPSACSWTASTSTPWITLGATSGTAPGIISYTVAANSTISARTGSIRVSWSGGFADAAITQAGGGTCSFTLIPESGNFPAGGGSGSFTVMPSDSACAWTAASDSSWLAVVAGASGTGPGTVSYSVQSYAGSTGPRAGSISVTGTVSGLRGFPVQQQPPP